MNTNDTTPYNPADDDNQGIVQLMVQGEESNSGVSQGPEPEKQEVNDSDGM